MVFSKSPDFGLARERANWHACLNTHWMPFTHTWREDSLSFSKLVSGEHRPFSPNTTLTCHARQWSIDTWKHYWSDIVIISKGLTVAVSARLSELSNWCKCGRHGEDRRSWGTARIWAFCEAVEGDTATLCLYFIPSMMNHLQCTKQKVLTEFFVN